MLELLITRIARESVYPILRTLVAIATFVGKIQGS